MFSNQYTILLQINAMNLRIFFQLLKNDQYKPDSIGLSKDEYMEERCIAVWTYTLWKIQWFIHSIWDEYFLFC
mgnify:CR=1 FL=1